MLCGQWYSDLISPDAHGELLDCIYAAAVDPRLWSSVLERFADFVGGSEADIIVQDEIKRAGRAIAVRRDPLALPLYLTHYIKCSPLLKTEAPAVPRVLTDDHKIPKDELMRTEFYNDFLRRFDCHSLLIARLAVDASSTACINVVRPRHREAFGNSDIEVAMQLHPHLVRAWRLSTKAAGAELWRSGAEVLLQCSTLAVFLLDDRDRLRHVNEAGESLLAASRALTIRNGALRATNAVSSRKLEALIARARAPEAARRSGGMMSLARENQSPLSISVTPVRGERFALFDGELQQGPAVLVCISDPEPDAGVREESLRDLFGLTPAEARVVAQLVEGCEPREIARRLGVSFYTVRGHLARIFDKLGVNRQAQLVQLVMRAIGQLPESSEIHFD